MKRKHKGKASQEKAAKDEIASQSAMAYVPGSVAGILGSSQAGESSAAKPGKGSLSSFFQPTPAKFSTPPQTQVSMKSESAATPVSQSPRKGIKSTSSSSPAKVGAGEGGKRRKAKEEEDEEEEGPRQKKRKPPVHPPDDPQVVSRTVFVGNLPTNITKNELKGLFRVYGAIESLRFRSVCGADPSVSKKVAVIKNELNPKRNSFNGYIVFKTEESAQAALKHNGMLIHKHHVRVDIAGNNKQHDMKRSLFVGNVPFNLEEEELRDHFEEFGTIEGVRLIRDKATGVGKGIGYVLFEDSASVKFALKKEGSMLKGRKIRVKRAVKKEKQKDTGSYSNPRANATRRWNSASGSDTYKGHTGQQRRNPPANRGGKQSGFRGKKGFKKPKMKHKGKKKHEGRKAK